MLRNNCTHVVQLYLDYKTHVCRQVFHTDNATLEQQLDKHETAWPDYKEWSSLVTIPEYLREPSGDAVNLHDTDQLADHIVQSQQWLDTYLQQDVEQVQQMKQHAVHLLNVYTQVRELLAACRRKDNPNLCYADFPRMRWLVTKAVILCAMLLQQMDQRASGRRCMLGSMHGPMNHPSIHGTHPAMLACHRCNSDAQLPYRFPIIPESHCCDDETWLLDDDDKDLVHAAQAAQDAQAGYAFDYCTKRQPCACNGVK